MSRPQSRHQRACSDPGERRPLKRRSDRVLEHAAMACRLLVPTSLHRSECRPKPRPALRRSVARSRMPRPLLVRTMKLGAFVHETGQHVAAWRHPGAYTGVGIDFAQATDVARTAERGKFDLLFLADGAAVSVFGSDDARGRMGKVVKFEPITLLSALAAVTRHLGLVATATTTYGEPYTLARTTKPRPSTTTANGITRTPIATTVRWSSPRSSPACGTVGKTMR